MVCEACGEVLGDEKQPEEWAIYCPDCFDKVYKEFLDNGG
jgi:hypothetical protein